MEEPDGNGHPEMAEKIDRFSRIYGLDGCHLSGFIHLFI
jgi:hypothetical protein